MSFLNLLNGFLGDALLRPFSNPWTALAAAALVTSLLMLLVIRWTSSPAAIRRAKNRLLARVLELVLFRHDALVSFTAGGWILTANLAYLRTLLWPLAVSLVPCLLILAQLACWFDARPLQVGEPALIEVKLRAGLPVIDRPAFLSGANAVRVETEGIRLPQLSEIDWRLRGARAGMDAIEIHYGDEPPVQKQIVVGDDFRKVSRRRIQAGLWEQFLNPAEPPLDNAQSVVQVEVRYPARQLYLGNLEIHWLVAFLVLTIVFALFLKRPLNVQI